MDKQIEQHLAAFFGALDSLNPDSPPEAWSILKPLRRANRTAYPSSMREHHTPCHGPDAAIAGFKAGMSEAQVIERRLTSQTTDVGKRKVYCEMRNHLPCQGQHVDPFCETVVAEFHGEGKIADYKRYCCRNPLVAATQSVTGVGMYKGTSGVLRELGLAEPTATAQEGQNGTAGSCCA